MHTTEIMIHQTGGADETLKAAKAEFARMYPETFILNATFKWASPRGPRGRWVGIEITYT